MAEIKVNSPNVHYTSSTIESNYAYETTEVGWDNGKMMVTPKTTEYNFRTQTKVLIQYSYILQEFLFTLSRWITAVCD